MLKEFEPSFSRGGDMPMDFLAPADVERALEKLGDGTYGICDSCGETIGRERLAAITWATLCISCARTRSAF